MTVHESFFTSSSVAAKVEETLLFLEDRMGARDVNALAAKVAESMKQALSDAWQILTDARQDSFFGPTWGRYEPMLLRTASQICRVLNASSSAVQIFGGPVGPMRLAQDGDWFLHGLGLVVDRVVGDSLTHAAECGIETEADDYRFFQPYSWAGFRMPWGCERADAENVINKHRRQILAHTVGYILSGLANHAVVVLATRRDVVARFRNIEAPREPGLRLVPAPPTSDGDPAGPSSDASPSVVAGWSKIEISDTASPYQAWHRIYETIGLAELQGAVFVPTDFVALLRDTDDAWFSSIPAHYLTVADHAKEAAKFLSGVLLLAPFARAWSKGNPKRYSEVLPSAGATIAPPTFCDATVVTLALPDELPDIPSGEGETAAYDGFWRVMPDLCSARFRIAIGVPPPDTEASGLAFRGPGIGLFCLGKHTPEDAILRRSVGRWSDAEEQWSRILSDPAGLTELAECALAYTMILEALLVKRSEKIVETLARRASALLIADPLERATLSARIKRLYDIRSTYVHDGVGRGTLDDVADLRAVTGWVLNWFRHWHAVESALSDANEATERAQEAVAKLRKHSHTAASAESPATAPAKAWGRADIGSFRGFCDSLMESPHNGGASYSAFRGWTLPDTKEPEGGE